MLRRYRRQQIDGPGRCVRVRRLDVHTRFFFGRLELREVRVQQGRIAGIRMQVEQRSIKVRQEQRYDSVPGQDSSHAGILTKQLQTSQLRLPCESMKSFLIIFKE